MLQRYFLAPLAALLLLAAGPRLTLAQTTPTGGVTIGAATAPDASAALDIVSSSKGLLLPRLASVTSITNPAPGLLVYQTGGTPGFYYNSGTAAIPNWLRLSPGDNLGNHTATQDLNLNGQKLTGGGTNGLRVRPGGGVRIDTLAGTGQGRLLTVAPDGTLQASAPIQSQALTNSVPNPVLLGTAATGSYSFAVGVNAAGTRAYVASDAGLQAYDVSGSGAPVAVGSPAGTDANVRSLAVNAAGTRAYVASRSNSTLQAFDVSGGSTPVALGGPVATGTTPNDLALNAAGTRAYVVTNSNTLEAYDVSGSGAPVRLGSVTTDEDALTVALNGNGTRAYVATYASLLTYDVSGNGAPVLLSSFTIYDPNNATYPTKIAVNKAGTRAYLGYSGSSTGLQTFDVTGTTPTKLGNPVPIRNAVLDIALNAAATRAYITFSSNSILATYDLSGGVPVQLGSPVATVALGLVLNGAGTRAYVTGANSLQVFSLGAAPTVVGIGSDGSLGTLTLSQLADNLGNHTATQNLDLAGYQLVSGGSTGLALTSAGNVGIGTSGTPAQKLEVAGNVKISGTGNGVVFPDGSVQTSASSLSNLTGDVTSSGTTTTYNNVVPATKGGAGTVSGLLKANGSGLVSAAVAGTDYLTPAGAGTGFIQNATSPQANSNFNISGAGTVGGLLTAGNAVVSGKLGIGTTAAAPATQALDVRGNLRLGADGGSSAPGTGQAIEFVGPGVNTDPVGLYRVNPAADVSELRVVVGDVADAGDKFVVGRTSAGSEGGIPAGTFTPSFTVRGDGNVGIGTTGPGQKLEVAGQVFSSTGGFRFPDNTVQTTAALTGGSAVLNQTSQQANANFNISGNGYVGGNVGIGTTTPGQKLEVAGQVFSNTGGFRFPDNTVQTTAAVTPTGTNFIQNATSQQTGSNFNISGTGTVGGQLTAGSATVSGQFTAGTATVGGLLTAATLTANTSSRISSQGAYLQWNRSGSNGETWLLNQKGGGPGGLRFGATDAVSTGGNTITEWARFNESGNLGIGTITPSQKLEVAGQVFSNTGGFRFPDNTVQTTAGVAVGSAVLNQTSQQAGSNFNISGTGTVGGQLTAGSATVSGNVGIGISSPIGGLHIDRPEVGNGSQGQSLAIGVVLSGGSSGSPNIELRGDGKTPYIDFVEASNFDYTTRLISQGGGLSLLYGGPAKSAYLLNVDGGISATGAVRGTNFAQTSDARFKTNVRPLTSALASVLALRGVRYEWNALGVERGGTAGAGQVGVIAQEVEKIYPELVSTDKDGYKAVNYAQLTPVLIEAIKELKAENEALKAQAAADKTQATADKAQATATLDSFEARLRALEAGGTQARK